jgi:hypothetical protein
VRLQLHALAYNLGNFLRTLATPEPIKDWSLTTLKDKLIKIGAKVVSHGRYVAFQMAEVAIPRQMFQEILRLIGELRPQPTTSASMRRSTVMRSRATDRRSASKCQGEWPDQTLDQAFGLPEVLVGGQHLASILQEGRENANIDAGLGFIWRISVKFSHVSAASMARRPSRKSPPSFWTRCTANCRRGQVTGHGAFCPEVVVASVKEVDPERLVA